MTVILTVFIGVLAHDLVNAFKLFVGRYGSRLCRSVVSHKVGKTKLFIKLLVELIFTSVESTCLSSCLSFLFYLTHGSHYVENGLCSTRSRTYVASEFAGEHVEYLGVLEFGHLSIHIKFMIYLARTLGSGDIYIGVVQPQVVTKSARTGVYSTHLSLSLIEGILKLMYRVCGYSYIVLVEVLGQLLECDVVIYRACIYKLVFLCYAGRKNSDRVGPSQILSYICSHAHDRAVYRRKVRKQLRLIGLDILNYGSTGLSDYISYLLCLDSSQMRPRTDIRTVGYVVDYTVLFPEIIKYALPLSRIYRLDSGSSQYYQLFLIKTRHSSLGIVKKISCAVVAGLYAFAAGNTSVIIYSGDESAVLKYLGDIRLRRGTGSDAGITADAFFGLNYD